MATRRELPDRSEILFGREPDLTHLLTRSRKNGITAVVGRPQMGKSWLLTELARQLSQTAKPTHSAIDIPTLLESQTSLVGYTESLGETADLMLRAVVDLYSRWLSDSTYRQQAQIVYQQQKVDLVGRIGNAVGTILKELSKLGAKPIEVVGSLVKETFDALATANRDLTSGGIELPRLQLEQAQDLLTLLHKITNCSIILVFDQWEKSPGLDLESRILDSFLRHLDEWPPCHIFLGVRSGEQALKILDRLKRDSFGAMELYELPPMHLDKISAVPLLDHLREKVSAAKKESDRDLLDMISGYPGTVSKWTSSYYANRLDSSEELQRAADDANAYRFAEFEDLLTNLTEKQRLLSIRLALIPSCGNAERWSALRTIVLDEIPARDIDALKRLNVLEQISPPTYGHAKRSEAALQWFIANCYGELREICELLIFSFAGKGRGIGPAFLPFTSSLADLDITADRLELAVLPQALCSSAAGLFESVKSDGHKLLEAASICDGTYPFGAPLLAMGLFNALNHAKEEQNLERRDALLEGLRNLALAHPEEAAVRELLAKGLFNTLIDSKEEQNLERRDALLEELRNLALAHPEDAAVRQRLAMGLLNTLNHSKEEQNLERRGALLQELRNLALAHPEDAAVRQQLAMGLFNTLNHAKEEQTLERRDALLEELRNLALAHPEDAAVRQQLAMGLFNTLNHAREEQTLERRDALLEELRNLELAHPEEAAAREWLAMGLFNTLIDAKEKQALERRDVLLEELRNLALAHPEEAVVRERLSKGLFNTLIDSKEEQNLGPRDALLEELRNLALAHPEDAAAREWLAKGLFNTLIDAEEEKMLERRDALLEELRELIQKYPENGVMLQIREQIENI